MRRGYLLLRLATRAIVLVVAVASRAALAAGPWIVDGRVVRVSDGDTITVLDAERKQHKVRLAGIDAPERKQPFGTASKDNRSRLVFDRRVEARCHKRDRYGREVCAVFIGSRDRRRISP